MGLSEEAISIQEERSARLKRIRRVSRFMKWFVTLILATVVLSGILISALVLIPETLDVADEMIDIGESERKMGEIPFAQRATLVAFFAFTFVILTAICWQIRQLFEYFSKGDFFSPKTLSRILAIGFWLIAFGVYDIVTEPIASFLLTLDLPEGQRQIELAFDGGELFFIVFGGLMIVFGWTMREASMIAEENKQFI